MPVALKAQMLNFFPPYFLVDPLRDQADDGGPDKSARGINSAPMADGLGVPQFFENIKARDNNDNARDGDVFAVFHDRLPLKGIMAAFGIRFEARQEPRHLAH